MSARLHLCGADALERLVPMVAAFHAETGVAQDDAGRRAALSPLLEGSPYGAAYLVGPERAPVGYLVVAFTWSVSRAGMVAVLDELWVRPAVRGRGMASEAVAALTAALKPAGLVAITLQTVRAGPALPLFQRLGFVASGDAVALTRAM